MDRRASQWKHQQNPNVHYGTILVAFNMRPLLLFNTLHCLLTDAFAIRSITTWLHGYEYHIMAVVQPLSVQYEVLYLRRLLAC